MPQPLRMRCQMIDYGGEVVRGAQEVASAQRGPCTQSLVQCLLSLGAAACSMLSSMFTRRMPRDRPRRTPATIFSLTERCPARAAATKAVVCCQSIATASRLLAARRVNSGRARLCDSEVPDAMLQTRAMPSFHCCHGAEPCSSQRYSLRAKVAAATIAQAALSRALDNTGVRPMPMRFAM